VGYFKNLEIELQEAELKSPKPATTHVAYGETGVPPMKAGNYAWIGYVLIGVAFGIAVGVFL
jgi:hypothetical protein